MKNSLGDLTNHLFVALERLNDEGLAPDALTDEIKRANAVAGVAREIVAAGHLAVTASKLLAEQPSASPLRVLGLSGPAPSDRGGRQP